MGFLGEVRLVYTACALFFSFFFFALLRIPAGLFVSMSASVFFSLGHFLNSSTVCRYASDLLHRFYYLPNPIQ